MDAGTTSSRRTLWVRVVAILGATAAIGVLVATRLASDPTAPVNDSADQPRSKPSGSADIGSTTTTPPVYALADTPETPTKRQIGGLHFTDVTSDAGLKSPQSAQLLLREASMTSGASVADIDTDGDYDIFLTRVGLPNALYRNNGDGTFTDIAAESGVRGSDPSNGSSAAAFADVNADGCTDLYVTAFGGGTDQLFVNDCNGHFTDQTAQRGVDIAPSTIALGAHEHGAVFDDFDHDGDMDLLVTHWDPAMTGGNAAQRASIAGKTNGTKCEAIAAIRAEGADRNEGAGPNRSRFYVNDGAGHFANKTVELGVPFDQIAAFTPQFVDIDNDGWSDLLITGDFCTSRVFHNDHGTRFVDITERVGVATDENGMGSVVRDINGDGTPDWFISSIRCAHTFGNTGCSGNRLYINKGDGTFTDQTDKYGVRHGWWGWGAAIEDFGDDGRLEVVQTNGFVAEKVDQALPFTTDPLRFWIPTAANNLRHIESAKAVGLTDTNNGHALVPFDYDNDGDLDILIANFHAPPTLWRNDRPTDRSSISIRLMDPTHRGNRQGIGAKVVVRLTADSDPITGWIVTTGSYESQKPAELHIGVHPKATKIASIEVWWPGASDPQTLRDVNISRIVEITRRS